MGVLRISPREVAHLPVVPVIVEYTPGYADRVVSLIESLGGRVRAVSRITNVILATVPREKLQELATSPYVVEVDLDRKFLIMEFF